MAKSSVSRLGTLLPSCLRARIYAASTPLQTSSLRPQEIHSCRKYATETARSVSRTQQYPQPKDDRTGMDHPQKYPPPRFSMTPPTLSEIRSTLPPTRNTYDAPDKLVGTVTRTGTMRSTVQITITGQAWDPKFRRYFKHVQKLMAHEPTGYLRTGDLVEIARFSPATMGTRYESGRLDRRGGGTRYEVHRVITPWVTPIAEREELQGKGELWERFGVVEFERRTKEMGLWYNRDNRGRMVTILEGMAEAIGWEIRRVRQELGLRPYVEGEGLAESLSGTLGEVAARIRSIRTETYATKPAVV